MTIAHTACLALTSLIWAGPVSAQALALAGATVYDGTGGPPLESAVILVEDGRVTCIGAAETCPVPRAVERIDLRGRFITPGLVDAHVHFAQTGWAEVRPESGIGAGYYDVEEASRGLEENPGRWHRAYLCSGITGVYDTGGAPWTARLERDAEDDPERAGVRASGPMLAVGIEEPLEAFRPMRTDASAFAAIDEIVGLGSSSVKVYLDAMPPELADELEDRLVRIGEYARARGLSLIAHATTLRGAKAAVRAGAHMLVHSVMEPVDAEFLRSAREAGTLYATTLFVYRNWTRARASAALGAPFPIDDPNSCVDAGVRRVIGDVRELSATLPASQRDLAAVFSSLEASGSRQAVIDANLRAVYEAGLPIVAATDAGNALTLHGPAIYAEMEGMEAAGIPATDVLVMATRNGAAALGRLDDFGTLESGKVADLVVLTEDPGQSARAFRSITHVMRRGTLHPIDRFASR